MKAVISALSELVAFESVAAGGRRTKLVAPNGCIAASGF